MATEVIIVAFHIKKSKSLSQMGSMVFQVRQKQRMEGQPQTCHIF